MHNKQELMKITHNNKGPQQSDDYIYTLMRNLILV